MSSQPEDPIREKLKASLWFSVGKLIDEECRRLNTTATPQFIGAMTEMVWAQIETVSTDLESFSRHASRTTITTDDVLLVTRRNDALHGIMRDFIDAEKARAAGGMGKARKSRR
ncbi:apoptosis-inducing TAF9-like domain 1 family protein [Diplocarpon rosae]|nr:apoptosis-inducing TAF9-like domain 1 family protein [Diplocarpon rosae]